MAEYQKIEYRIGQDGKVVETVLSASGTDCIDATTDIEQVLGNVDSRQLLPEYYEGDEDVSIAETQTLSQT
jgi:hypothetical protein